MDYIIITPTGNREVLLRRTALYIQRQTVQPLLWVVVDDGNEPFPITEPQFSSDYPPILYLKRLRLAGEPVHTLRLNMQYALQHLPLYKNVGIFIFEDDDWYAPTYVEKLLPYLQHFCLIGEGNAAYYNVYRRSYYYNHNTRHASLAQTAFHSSIQQKILNLCNVTSSTYFLDIDLWHSSIAKYIVTFSEKLCIGIKGYQHTLICRAGSTWGQTNLNDTVWQEDANLKWLEQFMDAESVEFYSQFYKSVGT